MTKLNLSFADRFVKLGPGRGGFRPGAGRKPSTIEGILKRLPPEAAELLIRELKAKAELIQVQIKLDMLIQADISEKIPALASDRSGHIINNIARAAQKGLGLSEKPAESDQECEVSQGPERNHPSANDSLPPTNKKCKLTQGPRSEQVEAKSETLAYRKWKLSRLKQG